MKRMFQRLLLAAFCWWTAQAVAAGNDTVIIDAASERILTEACIHLRSASRFAVDIVTEYEDVLLDGTIVTYHRDDTVLLQRPDRLRVEVLDDEGLRRLFVSSDSIVVHRPMSSVYSQTDSSGTLNERLAKLKAKGISLPLDDLLNERPCSELVEHMETATFVGNHYIGGRSANHLLIATDTSNLQLWVANNDEPEILKMVIHYRELAGQPRFTARFSNWDIQHGGEDEFAFEPPEGTRRIEFRKSTSAQGGE